MEIAAVNKKGSLIPVIQFFEQFEEFSQNTALMEQTARYLKAIIRHPDDIMYIAQKSGQGYHFFVDGRTKRYAVFFEIQDDMLVLKTVD